MTATAAICTVFASIPSAFAQDGPNDIAAGDIAAGDLATALRSFEARYDVHISIAKENLRDKRTKGVSSSNSASEAIGQLLAGTGLKACSNGSVIDVVAQDANCSAHNADIIVTGTAISHLAETTRTGTRMDADPMTLPISVSSVSNELIQRQQAMNLKDIVANVSGIDGGQQGSVAMRGFGANIMRNGNLGSDGQSNNLPAIAISSVEAVKGPEAIIAGVGATYGGIVNVISKTPPLTPTAEFNSTVGSRGYYDIGADIGGPLNSDKNILVRLVGSTQDSGRNIAGYNGVRSDYIAPSMTLRMPEWGSTFTAQYEYQKLRRAPDVIVGTGGPELTSDLPIRLLGPRTDGTNVRSKLLTLSLEQELTDEWTFALRYSDGREKRRGVLESSFIFDFIAPAPNILTFRSDQENDARSENFKAELRGEFNTGPIEHKLLLSYDVTKAQSSTFNTSLTVSTTNLDTGVITDQTDALGPFLGAPGPRVGGGTTTKDVGLLLLNQMTWGKFVVLAGVRRMKYQQSTLTGGTLEDFTRTLPSLGAVYRITPSLSLYGNASKGFKPNQ
ncbi:MAG: TonB-dependent receptor, partial [Sphingomonas sp.]|uniref:TonB-dependent siderophore receptor n=1 Tax=Sphingomonas sp. TaxID=28214 RepID=UPI002605985B